MSNKDRQHPDLPSRIAFVMKTMDWNQAEMAREVGTGSTTVNNWLARPNGSMDPHYAFVLQDKHRWNARWLLEGVGPARMEVLTPEHEMLLERVKRLQGERLRALSTLLKDT